MLDAEKTICHGRYLDAVLGLGSAEFPLRVFTWEARWWRQQHTYSRSAMDEPPQALSPPPTASHVVRFSSPFSIAKLCSSCSGLESTDAAPEVPHPRPTRMPAR